MPEESLSIGFSDFSDLAAVLELKGVRATLRGTLRKYILDYQKKHIQKL